MNALGLSVGLTGASIRMVFLVWSENLAKNTSSSKTVFTGISETRARKSLMILPKNMITPDL